MSTRTEPRRSSCRSDSLARAVGIFRNVFNPAAEPFLAEQVGALRRHSPILISRRIVGQTALPRVLLADGRLPHLRQMAFALTRASGLIPRSDALRDLSLIHAHFGPDGLYALPLAERLEIPLAVTFHGFDATMSKRALLASGMPSSIQYALFQGQLKKRGRAFIAVSDFIKQRLLSAGYPADRVFQHYIGVDLTKFLPQHEESGERHILCVGRHVPVKGIDTLICAFARIASRHPDVRLLQVGSGPQTAELAALVRKLNLEGRVLLLGPRPHDEIVRMMRRAEVFALPSQTAADGQTEGLGIVFNEASACTTPIVATRHGGIPEAVLDGQTGFLVPERDDLALSEKLDLLLGDRGLARECGRRGREYVEDVFNLETQTRRLEELYGKLIR